MHFPYIDPLTCEHDTGETDQFTDVTGAKFRLMCCDRCGMQFVEVLDGSEPVRKYAFLPEGWIH